MTALRTSPLVKTYTLEEFWSLPEPDEGFKLELIAGVLFMTPPPDATHDAVVARLLRVLATYLDSTRDKGTLYVPRAALWTGTNTYVEPDLFYISARLAAQMGSDRRQSADLVIEVVSPTSAIYDRTTKADTYAALGVRELWLVDQAQETVEVKTLGESGFTPGVIVSKGQPVQSTVLPRLNLGVDELFRD
jgi:Uma2 family endonuclease